MKFLRPEFVSNYEKALKADTFKNLVLGEHSQAIEENDRNEIHEASRFMKNVTITTLVQLLESIILPLHSEAITDTFHNFGINMRYLGYVARMSSLDHIKQICVIEMLARTMKRIFNCQISDTLRENAKEQEKEEFNMLKEPKTSILKEGGRSSVYKKQVAFGEGFERAREEGLSPFRSERDRHQLSQDLIIDYLNLIFSRRSDPETSEFWLQCYQVASDRFNYSVKQFEETEVNLNALFFALQHHIGFSFELKGLSLKLGKTEQPF